MAGSNAVAFMVAYPPILRALFAGQPVTVDDAVNLQHASMTSEYIYLGHFEGPGVPLAFQGGLRLPRREDIATQLHIEVKRSAATAVDCATRALAIGSQIEDLHAADPKLAQASIPGLLAVVLGDRRLTPGYVDDSTASAELIYNLTITSMLG